MKAKTLYTVGQTLVSKINAGPVKRGDAVIVLQAGQGTFNRPFYKVYPVGGDPKLAAFISEENLAAQQELF